jgi:hypothetical protein
MLLVKQIRFGNAKLTIEAVKILIASLIIMRKQMETYDTDEPIEGIGIAPKQGIKVINYLLAKVIEGDLKELDI